MIYPDKSLYEKVKVDKKYYVIDKFAPLAGNTPDEGAGMGYARYACNLRISNGYIKHTSGIGYARANGNLLPSTVTVGDTIKDAAVFQKYDYDASARSDELMILGGSGRVYTASFGSNSLTRLTAIPESTEISFLNYHYNDKDVMLMFDAYNGNLATYDGTNVSVCLAPKISSACVYDDRIYGVENVGGNKLRLSGKNDPYEWSDASVGAGSINFTDEGGVLRRVVPRGEDLYVFRDYSVYKLTAYKGIKDYGLTKIFSSVGKIYAETAAVWNGKMYFMTENGFYSVVGSYVCPEWKTEFTIIEDGTHSAGVCFDGIYYVSAKIKTEGTPIGDEASCAYNNGVIGMLIGTDGMDIIRGADVKKFLPCYVDGKGKLFLINSPGLRSMNLAMFTEESKIYGSSVDKRWESPQVALGGRNKIKTVRTVRFRSNTDAKLKVLLDENAYEYNVSGRTDTITVPVNKCGESIKLCFSSTADNFRIYRFEIEYEETDKREYGAN